ncbi:septum formation family protein [Frigoribacterium sp. Leaf186]|uniref:septum formation family protein n=1 Tax=Frigoribacterium sp. Leaf186 TaxID=1736293 RepID=UPI0006F9232E|nr:septum formation family protein [Frigoribacterium sp. Leaf186]KQS17669.1 hypothetical protein ASG05_09600 [Frigoribacterium sp. Leaf186]
MSTPIEPGVPDQPQEQPTGAWPQPQSQQPQPQEQPSGAWPQPQPGVSPHDPFATPAPTQAWAAHDPYAAPPAFLPALPPQPSRTPWIVGIVGTAVVALVVGGGAGLLGGLSLAGGVAGYEAGYGDGSTYGDEDPTTWFGSDAVYGDYLYPLDFSGVTGVDGLDVGTCFTVGDLGREGTGDVETASCDEAHDEEAYLVGELDGGEFPGGLEVFDEASAQCDAAFADYVGASYDESLVDYGVLAPTEKGWDDGERSVVCYLYTYGTTRVGSLAGSGA